jgi:succinate-acetate transporter protein
MSEATDRQGMTTTAGVEVPAPRQPALAEPEPEFPPEAPVGDPLVLGLPAFVVGSVALGLVQINFAPAAAAGAAIPIILTATALWLLISAIWAARLAQNAVAAVLGVFGMFWLSYVAVVIGLSHRWWAIIPAGVARSVEVFLISWIVILGLMALGTLRLPSAYTAIMVLATAALVLLLIATVNVSTSLTKTAGWVVLVFAAVGAYAWLSSLSAATGGKPFPLGRPVIK